MSVFVYPHKRIISDSLIRMLSGRNYQLYSLLSEEYDIRIRVGDGDYNKELYDFIPISSNVTELMDMLNTELNVEYTKEDIENMMKRGELKLALLKDHISKLIYNNLPNLELLGARKALTVIQSVAALHKLKPNKEIKLVYKNDIGETIIIESPTTVNIITNNYLGFHFQGEEEKKGYYDYTTNKHVKPHLVKHEVNSVMIDRIISVINMNRTSQKLRDQYIEEYKNKHDVVTSLRSNLHQALIRIQELRALKDKVKVYTLEDLDDILSNIKKLPKVREVALINSKLVVRTELLQIPDKGQIYISGVYDIVLDFLSINERRFEDIRFINRLLNVPGYNGYHAHPHVINDDDTACLGTWIAPLEENYSIENIDVLVHHCIKFLQSVDSEDSAGHYIKYWPTINETSVLNKVDDAYNEPLSTLRTDPIIEDSFNKDHEDEDEDEE